MSYSKPILILTTKYFELYISDNYFISIEFTCIYSCAFPPQHVAIDWVCIYMEIEQHIFTSYVIIVEPKKFEPFGYSPTLAYKYSELKSSSVHLV